jgi:hypothetical protein
MKASIGGVYSPIWFGLKQTKSRVVMFWEYDPDRTKNQFKLNWFGSMQKNKMDNVVLTARIIKEKWIKPESLNSFDIILLEPWFDLSGLLEEGGEGARFVFGAV